MTNFGQLGIALALLAPTWVMIQVSLTSDYDGLAGIVGFLLGGVIIPTLAIVAVIVLGLPVRLAPRLNRWWAGNGHAHTAIASVAVGLMVAGIVKTQRQVGILDGVAYDVVTPDPGLLCGGWFLLAFLLVNAALPLRWRRRTIPQSA